MKLSKREQAIYELLQVQDVVTPLDLERKFGLVGNAMEVAVLRLRNKVAPVEIHGIYGVGFSLSDKQRRKA
jgi:DNA-binding response OmpR family regulator